VIQRFTDAGVEVCLTYGLFPAIRKNTAKHCDLMRVYCYIWNYLNFPVGVVPITTVREDEQHYESQYTDRLTEELVATMHGSAGLPVGVQVVGLPWHDELVVDTMVSLEEKLIAHGHSFFVLN
jgi:fatty acid amide hydrolase